MPNFTVKEYADHTPRKAISVEKGVSFRVRKVSNTVQRQWRYRFTRHNGKRDEITLPASGDKREHLAADLRMIAEWKNQVRRGIHPKRFEREERRLQAVRQLTFEEVALEFLPIYQSQLTNKKQQKAILSELERYVFPVIGRMPISELRVRDVADVLRPLWNDHYAVARKVKDRISRTCNYGVAMEYLGHNPVDGKALQTILGKTSYETRHFKAPSADGLPKIFQRLISSDDVYELATAFMLATLSRSLPLAHMKISEVQGDVWACPSTKNGNPYAIPLSKAALVILEKLDIENRAPDEFVFIGKRADSLPENVLLASIKRYSSDKSDTAHGVRATIRTWLEESHDFGEELLEVSMQHVVGTLTQRAYNRSDWLEKRRPIMEAISDWLLG
ncbi:hypothetical protein N9H49_05075 [Luminiphilus sp.]|nr:hypothetical protein [Luminiphilus sp.]